MTERGKYRAATALFSSRTEFGKLFPRVWIVKDSVYFTKNAARRAEEFERDKMVEFTIQDAHVLLHGKKMTPSEYNDRVEDKKNQSGSLFDGNLYSPIQYIPTYLRK